MRSTTKHDPTVNKIKGLMLQIRSRARQIIIDRHYKDLSPGERVWLLSVLTAGKALVPEDAWKTRWKVVVPTSAAWWVAMKSPMLRERWVWMAGKKRGGKPRTQQYFTTCGQRFQDRFVKCGACGSYTTPGYCSCGAECAVPKRRKARKARGKSPYSIKTYLQGSLHPERYSGAFVKPDRDAGAYPGVITGYEIDSEMWAALNIILGGEVESAWRSLTSNLTPGERWNLHIMPFEGVSRSQIRDIRRWYGRICKLDVVSRHVLYMALARYENDGGRVVAGLEDALGEGAAKSVLKTLRKCRFGELVKTSEKPEINLFEEGLKTISTWSSLRRMLVDCDEIREYASVYTGGGTVEINSPGIWGTLCSRKPRQVARDSAA